MKIYKENKAEEAAMQDIVSVFNTMTVTQQLRLIEAFNKRKHASVEFSDIAWKKMMSLIEECDKEIAWDGIVTRDSEHPNEFFIEDILLYPQMVTGATVNTDDIPYTKWLDSLDDETFNKRRFNGHSHVRMGVTPSATDMQYREDSMRNIKDFFIYGIFNKNNAINMEIYDVENNVVYEDSDISVYRPDDYRSWAKSQIKESVKKQTYSNATTTPAKPATISYSKPYDKANPPYAGYGNYSYGGDY